jgi:hypothetical protein
MLDEWPEANHQFFTRRQIFFQSHPRARPVVQIAAVGGSIGGRRCDSRAVYSGSLRLENRSCHGTDHYSKPVARAGMFLEFWCQQTMRSCIAPMKKIVRTLRARCELLLNYFKARKQISSGVVEGLNNKAKVTMRRSYGFRAFRILELALYHSFAKLPEPDLTQEFF